MNVFTHKTENCATCDSWGSFIVPPVMEVEERHGDDFVSIQIILVDGRYYFSYQLKLDSFLRQKRAHIADEPVSTAGKAYESARKEICKICARGLSRRFFVNFTKIKNKQLELFDTHI